MTENVKNKNFISPHLNKIKELQKKERVGLKTYAIFDHTPEGTADLEDLDEWVKIIAERIDKMKSENLTNEDLQNLISCLTTKQIQLSASGDYPEKESDKRLKKKLINLSYELRKTSGELMIVSDE